MGVTDGKAPGSVYQIKPESTGEWGVFICGGVFLGAGGILYWDTAARCKSANPRVVPPLGKPSQKSPEGAKMAGLAKKNTHPWDRTNWSQNRTKTSSMWPMESFRH
mgnify:CR=1 FL=1|jgi:hypothetical protein